MMWRTVVKSLAGLVGSVLCALVFAQGPGNSHNLEARDAGSQAAIQSPVGIPALLLGAAWYPEQWPEVRWEQDLTLMQAAGIHVVRVAEFAWSRMEPRESEYDLDWLERAVALAAKHHIVTVLGTPTAAPPAWLTQKYPDTLRIDENGKRAEHGNRQQFSFTSPRYREFARKIATEMAKRFGHNPNVIGWQIDNEYAEVSFNDYTRQQFHRWLQSKYGTLDNLNQHWTTAYWSQTYDNWGEIPIEVTYGNPGLLLEWKHFVNDTWRDYQKNQLDAIRASADSRQFITTNLMGWFDGFDQYEITDDLDLAAWDDYLGDAHLDPYRNGALHDLTRGLKRKNFWVMETQPGFVNWAPVNVVLDKGEVRAMAWEAVGHGADAVEYWQWRSALNGQEQYHGNLVGPDGTPVPLYTEITQLGREFENAAPILQGTSPKSEVAILHSYDSRWAIDWQKHNRNYDQAQVLRSYYRSLRQLAQSIDIVSPSAPLDGYKLVVAPSLNVLPEDIAAHLLAYVKSGGHLVLGPRSGMKDQYNALHPQRQPGPLATALGGRVEQYYALADTANVSGEWGKGNVTIWAEQLKATAPDTKALLTYDPYNGWLDSQPAVLTHAVGKGRITYIGALLEDRLMDAAAKWMVQDSGVKAIFGPVPERVEVCRRVGPRGNVYVLINTGREVTHVSLPRSMNDVLGGHNAKEVSLDGYGVAVLSDF